MVTASFKFENQIVGSGIWCFTMSNNEKVDQTVLVGSEGKITFSFFHSNPIEIYKDGLVEKIDIEYPKHVQQGLIESIVNDLLGKESCVSTGQSGARTNRILEKIIY